MLEIGYVLSQEQHRVDQLIEIGIAAEKAGFDRIWTSDHFLPWMDNQPHAGSAWLTLAALGQRVNKITMGTGVTCPTYRYNPSIVAQSFATLGILYPGRVFLGVGSGEAINEYTTTGKWEDYEIRVERLIEAISLIRQLWTGEWVTFRGKYYQALEAKLYDIPSQPVPIYMAASGEESLKLAGIHADGLITGGQDFMKAESRKAYEEGLKQSNRTLNDVSVHVESFVFVGTEDQARQYADLWRFIPKAWTDFVHNPDPRDILKQARERVTVEEAIAPWIIGDSPDPHIENIQKLVSAGATHIYIHSPQANQQQVIDFYSKNVLPHVKEAMKV